MHASAQYDHLTPDTAGVSRSHARHDRFRRFLEEVSGFDGLHADVTLDGGGVHRCYRDGFLNIHADFTAHHSVPDWRRRVNLLLYQYVPGFWLFREPMSKLGQLLVIAFAILLALFPLGACGVSDSESADRENAREYSVHYLLRPVPGGEAVDVELRLQQPMGLLRGMSRSPKRPRGSGRFPPSPGSGTLLRAWGRNDLPPV